MKNNESPRSDGFTAEFFKVYWLQLGAFVVRSFNDGFRRQELSSLQKEGVIICVPIDDKAKHFIKNKLDTNFPYYLCEQQNVWTAFILGF